MFVSFNPKQHKAPTLYELQSKQTDQRWVTTIVKSDATVKQASAVPWFYLVEVEDDDAA